MFKIVNRLSPLLLSAALLIATNAHAQFSLDAQNSAVNFLSTKNVNVTESHTFDRIMGSVSDSGELSLAVDLTSVNTIIPIRNERMQSMLFNVTEFSRATFTASVEPALLTLAPGQTELASITGDLTISGVSNPIMFHVRITGLQDGKFAATTTKPTLISANTYGLEAGVEALREVAMLQNISTTVPFSFSVIFEKD